MEMAVLQAMCPQAFIRDTVDVKGMSVAAQGSLWGGGGWMSAVGQGVAP